MLLGLGSCFVVKRCPCMVSSPVSSLYLSLGQIPSGRYRNARVRIRTNRSSWIYRRIPSNYFVISWSPSSTIHPNTSVSYEKACVLAMYHAQSVPISRHAVWCHSSHPNPNVHQLVEYAHRTCLEKSYYFPGLSVGICLPLSILMYHLLSAWGS